MTQFHDKLSALLEELDATTSIHPPSNDVGNSNGVASGNSKTVILAPLARSIRLLDHAILAINPFKYRGDSIYGTVNYMAPEQAAGKGKHDHDLVTDFYMVVKTVSKQAAAAMLPMVHAYQRFEKQYDEFLDLTAARKKEVHESAVNRLTLKLDKLKFKKIYEAIKTIHIALRDTRRHCNDDVIKIGLNKLCKAFIVFENAFTAAVPTISAYLKAVEKKLAH